MESDSMLSSFALNNNNNGSLINKAGYSTCNSQLNNNSNSNSSISNNLVVNEAITNQHAMMKSNSIINNPSECNKLQLTANSNLSSMFEANSSRMGGDEDVKDDNVANYKTHLMDDSQKFNLNNKHISCQQQQRDQNNPYGRMMGDINGSSTMPLNLCQVNFLIEFF